MKIVGDLPAQCHKILSPWFDESIDAKAVIPLRHLATEAGHELGELGRIELAFEDGLLDTLPVRFAHLCHPPKPLPPLTCVSRHVVSHEELHGVFLQ